MYSMLRDDRQQSAAAASNDEQFDDDCDDDDDKTFVSVHVFFTCSPDLIDTIAGRASVQRRRVA
jgi:hypothetical protein